MNYLTLIFNRVYFFLTKIGNQSPFIGTVILVSLLVIVFVNNIKLSFYALGKSYVLLDEKIEYFIMAVIFVLLYFYAKNRRQQIINNIKTEKIKDVIIISLFIVSATIYIFLANINRQKIFKEREKIQSDNFPKKESIEGKV